MGRDKEAGMFETAEVGQKVSKAEFAKAEPQLRARLLEAQRQLREAKFPVIVIVSGVEAAGKSEVVNRLCEWLDARGIRSVAFWDESDEERERPRHWRFWRRLPPAGTIGILFGSWYTNPIVQRAFRESGRTAYHAELTQITMLERTLTDGGALLVKLWFHISKKEQARRLEKTLRKQKRKLTPWEKRFNKMYNRFAKVSEEAIRATDTGNAPWHIVDAKDARHRDLITGQLLLKTIEQKLSARAAKTKAEKPESEKAERPAHGRRTILDTVNASARLTVEQYERELAELQSRLNKLTWKAWQKKRSSVALFEGWDAAGKGGAIRRVAASTDARLIQVIPVAAPTDEERAQHYLWRFWRHLPRAGYMTIYDRSWYGRVLVERVEGFATPEEWGRAFGEINAFEEQLSEHGICLAKFWLHITPEEQLRRFEERQRLAHKRHKITEEDWRNRKQWGAYEEAVDEMVARTSTANAPWTLVAANDKRHGRVTVLRTLCEALEKNLDKN
ncbi:MAG TPA: polyphosphate:AMP phosphotransferase [Gammaproteobacteria bacterium]|nr:polyphosphate:AMP phosphotransferase [Gammaproteobacteria bacterium]